MIYKYVFLINSISVFQVFSQFLINNSVHYVYINATTGDIYDTTVIFRLLFRWTRQGDAGTWKTQLHGRRKQLYEDKLHGRL